jgi:23S rRNA (adenine2030-N6)-methyltransferase
VHARDGYAAIKALLPPKVDGERYSRGLVLVDPPYEAQLAEFDAAFAALREGLARWPQAVFALWYPLKQRRALQPRLREAAALPATSILLAELLVRADDSPLRMNGSGMLLLNPPFGLETRLQATLPALRALLEEDAGGGDARLSWPKPRD